MTGRYHQWRHIKPPHGNRANRREPPAARPTLGLYAGLCLLACGQASAEALVREDIIANPSMAAFSVCQDHSCATLSTQSVTEDAWHTLTRDLQAPAVDAEQERRLVAGYVAAMEDYVGALTGTSHDLPGVFRGTGRPGQMDCIDEANNTSTYLKLLRTRHLLHWHQVGDLSTRGYFLFGWPHTSATLIENDTGVRYAVDSWFHANGEPPEILELARWKDGWHPARE